jgi:divalent metal cation (Fe/Co/Zn/Cd) transporter
MNRLLKKALILGIITVVYNIIEGLVSVFFGAKDETLALLGFGIDSFVEVISGIAIVHMILRMKYSKVNTRDKFERTALIINGSAFYLLTAGLIAGSALNIIYNIKPETTFAGIIISVISIGTMYYLMKAKLSVGRELKSDAIIADANCTKTCFYLSFILLASSGLYEIFKIGYFDVLGSLGIAYYAFKEGRESFEKSRSENLSCACDDD